MRRCSANSRDALVAEGGHDLFAESPHRGQVLLVAHVAEAGLAEEMADADIAQFRDLFLHPFR